MADTLKTILGFEASQAISTLTTLDSKFNAYTTSVIAAAGGTTKFNKSAAATDNILNKEKKAVDAATKALLRYGKTSSTLPSSHPAIKAQATAYKGLANQVEKGSKQILLSWQSVARIFAIQSIHKAVTLVTSALSESVQEAQALEISLAEIQTIAPSLQGDLEGVADSVQRLSDAYGITADVVAEGTYQTLSNQVADGARSFEFFASAADFSIGAVTSADAAVNLLSSTINSFGFNASQAATLSGKLFKIIELGRVRGEEFANTFGRITVLASQLGISLDEVGASIATLTISGLKYNEASTLITNTMLKLIRPTEELRMEFQRMGIESAEAGIQAFGFQGFLEKLRNSAGKSASAIGDLFGRVRAIRGVLGLTSDATEQYQQNLEAIATAGGADIQGARQLIFETNAKEVQIEVNRLKNAIVFDFGRTALAVLNDVFQAFGGAVNVVKGLTVAIGAAAAGFTVMAAVMFPIPAAILAVSVGVALLVANIAKLTETEASRIEQRVQDELAAIEKINKAEGDLAESRIRLVNDQLSTLQKAVVERLASINEIQEAAITSEKYVGDIFDQQLADRASAYDSFVQAIKGKVDESAQNIIDAEKEIANIQKKTRADTVAQIGAIEDPLIRSMQAQRQAQLAINKAISESKAGRRESAQELFSEAESLLGIAQSSAATANNAGAEFQARKQLNRLYQEQIDAQRQIQQEEAKRAQEAQRQYAEEKARADRIKAIIEDLRDIRVFDEQDGFKFASPEAAQAEARNLVKALESEFSAVGAKADIFKQLDLQKQLDELTRPFEDAFTRQPVSLRFAHAQYIGETFKGVTDYFNSNPVPLRLRADFADLGINIETITGLQEASQTLIDIQKQYSEIKRDSASTAGEQHRLNNAIKAGEDFFNAFGTAAEERLGRIRKAAEKFNLRKTVDAFGVTGSADDLANAVKEYNSLARLQSKIAQAAGDARTAIEGEFDPNLYTSAVNRLEAFTRQLELAEKTDLADPVRGLIGELQKAAEAANQITPFSAEDIQIIEGAVRSAADGIKDAQEALGPGISDSAAVGASGVLSSAQQEIAAMNAVTAAANQAARAVAAVGGSGGAVGTANFGRPIYRAGGGFVPRGTDNVAAMLSPGETVINSASSRKFFSQLSAINSGRSPLNRQEGGPVTNVGDVNITVQESGSPMVTARETMAAFRRETRRRSSRI